MKTVSQAVEEIVKRSQFLEEGISLGILNFSSLARIIKNEVENKTYKKVSEGAIIMALKRLGKKIKIQLLNKNFFQKTPDIIIQSNLLEFTFLNSESLIDKYQKLILYFKQKRSYFMTITQGVFETGLITNEENENLIKKVFQREKIIKLIKDLAAITIRLPENNLETPGVYYSILKILSWENINIIEVVSTFCEFTVILKNKDVDLAFSILKRRFS